MSPTTHSDRTPLERAVYYALGHLRHCLKVGRLNRHDKGLVEQSIRDLESGTSGDPSTNGSRPAAETPSNDRMQTAEAPSNGPQCDPADDKSSAANELRSAGGANPAAVLYFAYRIGLSEAYGISVDETGPDWSDLPTERRKAWWMVVRASRPSARLPI